MYVYTFAEQTMMPLIKLRPPWEASFLGKVQVFAYLRQLVGVRAEYRVCVRPHDLDIVDLHRSEKGSVLSFLMTMFFRKRYSVYICEDNGEVGPKTKVRHCFS